MDSRAGSTGAARAGTTASGTRNSAGASSRASGSWPPATQTSRCSRVTHGGPIRSAWATALGLALDAVHGRIATLENCATVRIAVRDGILERVD